MNVFVKNIRLEILCKKYVKTEIYKIFDINIYRHRNVSVSHSHAALFLMHNANDRNSPGKLDASWKSEVRNTHTYFVHILIALLCDTSEGDHRLLPPARDSYE